MSATSALESEDLDNVPLVRMEDVQPDRYEDCVVKVEHLDEESVNDVVIRDEVLETCVVDSVASDCVVNDEDGNVVVTIHAEVFDGDSTEIIIPEPLQTPLNDPLELKEEPETKPNIQQPKTNTSGSWPTLEILPGGVINHADKGDNDPGNLYPTIDTVQEPNEEMMYACAKCSQSFKYLFCLVKHVKWHEEQQKRLKGREITGITVSEGKNYVCLHSNKRKIISKLKSRCKVPKKS
ncbi:uncharacterized protein [Epargyreus clarus]|uniref:uncharacterized protein isoform X2 n=1 Tax=Epargyreus clarus TaxID=520877 RepID=UPI003C3035B5